MAKNHEISVYFSTNAILGLCHAPPYKLRNSNALVSNRKMLLSWKFVNSYKVLLMPAEDKTFSDFLVLDLRT